MKLLWTAFKAEVRIEIINVYAYWGAKRAAIHKWGFFKGITTPVKITYLPKED